MGTKEKLRKSRKSRQAQLFDQDALEFAEDKRTETVIEALTRVNNRLGFLESLLDEFKADDPLVTQIKMQVQVLIIMREVLAKKPLMSEVRFWEFGLIAPIK